MALLNLENRNVVITGGTSGIGLAVARMAKEAGANVWGVGRSEKRVQSAGEAVPGAQFRSLDTHDTDGMVALFTEIGDVHHVVANATGANRTMAPFLEQSQEQFQEAFDKFWGYCKVIRAAAPQLADDASITLTSGVPARKCGPNQIALSCVGSAVEALTRALAFELAPRRVNVVSPGIINTGMFDRFGDNRDQVLEGMGKNYPLGRVGHSDEVAGAIIHTMTNGYMTGATLDVDGGALLP
ncbi:MAG: short-chain dehydrogenase [OM182 bacterium MED-G24]|uniref:Short-chain dehydrogenase n=1 Tax=OM182 bacterium MED-G24 TaxID=1986255 RepID=A0A2A5WLJ0_9GAMM|nr:MAG: short-chain dehydrogenase [OM182 bacterium MED-G24]